MPNGDIDAGRQGPSCRHEYTWTFIGRRLRPDATDYYADGGDDATHYVTNAAEDEDTQVTSSPRPTSRADTST